MFLTQVDWQMSEGVRALSNLLNMLLEAASGCKVSVKRAVGWGYSGINLEGLKYWVGIIHDDPKKLWFRTRCRIDPDAAARLGVGKLTEEDFAQGGHVWWRSEELYSEETHFFSRSKVGQIRWLENFLQECLKMARSIEIPDQTPIPEKPEES